MSKTFILIHGAWHANWCWKYVVPLLEQQGHRVINIDLPGHGVNQMAFPAISLTTYVNYVIDIIQSYNTPVSLVGHSMAGIVISQVAEIVPQAIAQLIYVTAFVPDHGGSLAIEAQKARLPGVSTEFIIDAHESTIDLKKSSRLTDFFYHCCQQEDIDFAANLMQKEPLQPFTDTVTLSAEKYGAVKKLYIECTEDKAITPRDQQRMAKKSNCAVIRIAADHSPFFSAPEALAAAIMR